MSEVGRLTCEIGAGPARKFVKWAPAGSDTDLGAEAVRLRWAARFAPVPSVLDEGADRDGAWLLAEALTGTMAVLDRRKQDPYTAVIGIGAGRSGIPQRPQLATPRRHLGCGS